MKKTIAFLITFLIRIAVSGQVTTAKLDSLLNLKTAQRAFNGSKNLYQTCQIKIITNFFYFDKPQ